jgi:hypothetical protein
MRSSWRNESVKSRSKEATETPRSGPRPRSQRPAPTSSTLLSFPIINAFSEYTKTSRNDPLQQFSPRRSSRLVSGRHKICARKNSTQHVSANDFSSSSSTIPFCLRHLYFKNCSYGCGTQIRSCHAACRDRSCARREGAEHVSSMTCF